MENGTMEAVEENDGIDGGSFDLTCSKSSAGCEVRSFSPPRNSSKAPKNVQGTNESDFAAKDSVNAATRKLPLLNGIIKDEAKPLLRDENMLKTASSHYGSNEQSCREEMICEKLSKLTIDADSKENEEAPITNHSVPFKGDVCSPVSPGKETTKPYRSFGIGSSFEQLIDSYSSKQCCCSLIDKKLTVPENSDITFVTYKSEAQMGDVMRLIQKDLSEPYSIYTYRYFINNWPHLCFLGMHKDKSIGVIVCKLESQRTGMKRGYIAMLAVDENYRKMKVGSTLVIKAIDMMALCGAEEVVLETETTNHPALNLYENLGFVRDKRLFRYYLNGVDAFRLKLWLR